MASLGRDADDCKLRDDIPLHSGVTTTIATGKQTASSDIYDFSSDEQSQHQDDVKPHEIDLELGNPRGKPHSKRISKHVGKFSGGRGTNRDTSDSRSLSSEEDSIWGMGITKTTNTKISSVRMSKINGGKGSS